MGRAMPSFGERRMEDGDDSKEAIHSSSSGRDDDQTPRRNGRGIRIIEHCFFGCEDDADATSEGNFGGVGGAPPK